MVSGNRRDDEDRTTLDERGRIHLSLDDRKGKALGGLVGISMLMGLLLGAGFWGAAAIGVGTALVFGIIIYKLWPSPRDGK